MHRDEGLLHPEQMLVVTDGDNNIIRYNKVSILHGVEKEYSASDIVCYSIHPNNEINDGDSLLGPVVKSYNQLVAVSESATVYGEPTDPEDIEYFEIKLRRALSYI